MSLQIRKLEKEECFINENIPVKVETAGNVVKVQYMSNRNSKATIQMLPGGKEYIELSTGEIKECVIRDNRSNNIKSLLRTFDTIRGIINSNVVDAKKCKWITLTYSENMTDTKKLKTDFNLFDKRFQYWCKKNGYPKAKYITMVEPQGRGAWHHHLLYIFPCVAPYISNDVIASLWGHGFTKTKKLNNVDNVGAYLTAYLADLEVTDDNVRTLLQKAGSTRIGFSNGIVDKNVFDDEGQVVKKTFIKGARLYLYPLNFNMFRCSRDIDRPVIEVMSQEKAKEKISSGKLTFSKTIQLSDDENDFFSIIHTEYYNLTNI